MLQLQFDTSNAMFEDNSVPETVRILREIADAIEEHQVKASPTVQNILDFNGNSIGWWLIRPE